MCDNPLCPAGNIFKHQLICAVPSAKSTHSVGTSYPKYVITITCCFLVSIGIELCVFYLQLLVELTVCVNSLSVVEIYTECNQLALESNAVMMYNTAVLEALAEGCPVPAACVAVEDEFGEVGTQGYLQKRFGLTAAHIEEQVKAVVARKEAE